MRKYIRPPKAFVCNLDSNVSYETSPIAVNEAVLADLSHTDGVSHVERFATKPGLLKTDSAFQGIVLKGWERSTTGPFSVKT